MKFKSFVSKSIFTEIMNGGDRRLFEMAYKGHEKPGDEVKVGAARAWVSDVLRNCATKLDIQFDQMVHAFQTGDQFAIQRVYRRRDDIDDKDVKIVIEMDAANLNTWIRSAMVDALQLSAPSFHRDSYKEHVGSKPKRDPETPRQEKSVAKPKVESKRPRALAA